MTALILVFGALAIAQTVLLSLIFLSLRDTLHTLALRESVRRTWGDGK